MLLRRFMQHVKDQNWFAVGLDVVVVIVGIFLGMQVQQWYEDIKDREIEQTYYLKFIDDLNNELTTINDLVTDTNARIETGKELILDLHLGTHDKYFILNKWLTVIRMPIYEPRRATYQDLLSSGNLNLINNEAIKEAILAYYSDIDNRSIQLRQNRDGITLRTFDYSYTELGLQELEYARETLGKEVISKLPPNDWHLDINDPLFKRFQDDLLFAITLSERQIIHFEEIKKEINKAMTVIEQNLNDE